MQYRYVPLIRWKTGERGALGKLSQQAKNDTVPLAIIAQDQYVGKKPTKSKPAISPPDWLAQQIQQSWGTAPIYIDAESLPTSGATHPLQAIGTSARNLGLNIIPCLRLTSSPSYQNAAGMLNNLDRKGLGLRVTIHQAASIGTWSNTLPFSPTDIDLIIDVGTITNINASNQTSFEFSTFFNLINPGIWRSITLLGTTIPHNFGGYAAGNHTISRTELDLWRNLTRSKIGYHLDFGDYVTVASSPPSGNIASGFPINAKYTLTNEYLICRGVRTKGPAAVPMSTQLRGHASQISSYPSRGALAYCWADTIIDQIAAGTLSTGNLTSWVGYSVNRHIECTRSVIP